MVILSVWFNYTSLFLLKIAIDKICVFLWYLADSWPEVFDDSEARRDWKWQNQYDLSKLVEFMIKDVKEYYAKDALPEIKKKATGF